MQELKSPRKLFCFRRTEATRVIYDYKLVYRSSSRTSVFELVYSFRDVRSSDSLFGLHKLNGKRKSSYDFKEILNANTRVEWSCPQDT